MFTIVNASKKLKIFSIYFGEPSILLRQYQFLILAESKCSTF